MGNSPRRRVREVLAGRSSRLFVAVVLVSLLAPPVQALAPGSGSGSPAWVSGTDAYYSTSFDDADRVVDALERARMNTYYTDANNREGEVAWASGGDAPRVFAFEPGDGPVARAVDAAVDSPARLAVAARYVTFPDEHHAEGDLAHARIGDSAWLDPACPAVQDHVARQVSDLLTRTRVDEVNLDFFRYPTTADASEDARLPCLGGRLDDAGPERVEAVAAALAAITDAIRGEHPQAVLTVSVFGASCRGPVESVGQDADPMAGHVDWLMPMLYPAHAAPASSLDPYGWIRETTRACVERTGAAGLVKPWIQGFDRGAHRFANPAAVSLEIQAVQDGHGTGAAVWWYETYGELPGAGHAAPQAFWTPLAFQMPDDGGQRPHR